MTYDLTGTGTLDRHETRSFLNEFLDEQEDLSNDAFERVFIQFDEDSTGTIKK